MPHDVMPSELSLDDANAEEELDNPPSHGEKKDSPFLTSMKEAGRALVRKAKRTIRKPALAAAMVAAGAALVAPHAAKAQSIDGWVCEFTTEACFELNLSQGPGAAAPQNQGNPLDRPLDGPGGDPVDIATGNVFLHVVDYTTAGPNPLQFIRYYNSLNQLANVGTLASTLGAGTASMPATMAETFSQPQPAGPVGWRTNYDAFLQFIPASGSIPALVIAERPDGQQINFAYNSGSWVPPTDQDYTLTSSGSTWVLTDHNDKQESYTDSGSGWAQLNTITLRNGYQQTLSYSGTYAGTNTVDVSLGGQTPADYYPNRLQSVTDSYGRSLTLGYNGSGLLTSVSTPDSLVVSYGYTTYGSVSTSPGILGAYVGDVGTILTSVSYNTSPTTSQTYNYAVNSSWPYQITSVVDENSNTAASWILESEYGRAVTSYQGGAGVQANYTYFEYDTGSTTVWSGNGPGDTYNFGLTTGVPKFTEVDRASTSAPGTRRRRASISASTPTAIFPASPTGTATSRITPITARAIRRRSLKPMAAACSARQTSPMTRHGRICPTRLLRRASRAASHMTEAAIRRP